MPNTTYRPLTPGMGQAVAERTILRKDSEGKWETWGDVACRVALGNTLLAPEATRVKEYDLLQKHIANATLLMSGRSLQHGDATQPDRTQEIFTNCASSSTSFITFLLLMSGCFRKDTPVRMADGSLKEIGKISPGDKVLSFDEKTKLFVTQTVTKININEPKPMVRLVTKNGNEIWCTEDHKFLTTEGWVQAKNLKGKKVIQCPKDVTLELSNTEKTQQRRPPVGLPKKRNEKRHDKRP